MVYVGFSTTNGLPSRLVRFMTSSTVSHSFMVFEMLGIKWVLEAEWVGVRIIPLSLFESQNTVVQLIPVKEIDDNGLRFAIDKIGTKYDFGAFFGNAIPLIGHWFKKKWTNPLNDSKAMICTEVVIETLRSVGYPGADCLDTSGTTPNVLMEFLIKQSNL